MLSLVVVGILHTTNAQRVEQDPRTFEYLDKLCNMVNHVLLASRRFVPLLL